jgi:hypothetical protein
MSANGLGRPTKLTPGVRAKVLDCLSVGAYAYTAAAAAGIAESTYYAWLDRGKAARDRIDAGESVHEDELEFLEFSESVTRVTAQVELRALQAVQDACLTDWRAASWFLERRHPQRWRPVPAWTWTQATTWPHCSRPSSAWATPRTTTAGPSLSCRISRSSPPGPITTTARAAEHGPST